MPDLLSILVVRFPEISFRIRGFLFLWCAAPLLIRFGWMPASAWWAGGIITGRARYCHYFWLAHFAGAALFDRSVRCLLLAFCVTTLWLAVPWRNWPFRAEATVFCSADEACAFDWGVLCARSGQHHTSSISYWATGRQKHSIFGHIFYKYFHYRHDIYCASVQWNYLKKYFYLALSASWYFD